MANVNQEKQQNFNRVLRSLYNQDKEALNANPLKDEFETAIDSVTYREWMVERELRDLDGHMVPDELTKFLKNVGSEMGLDPTLVEEEVNDITLDEIVDLYNDSREMIESGNVPIDVDLDEDVKSRQNEWFVEGYRALYYEPFDYKQQARERAEDLRAGEEAEQGLADRENSFYADYDDEDDITVDSNIDDVIHRPEDLTEENRKELIDQAYMNSPRAVEFSTFIADMQVNNLTGLSESPLRHEFKEAVEDYTKATETLDEHLRDANGNIDGKAFETFITGIGHQLELPSILVNDTVELMSEDENSRLQDPSDKYEWFNEKYEQVYGEPFDYVVSANQYFEEKRREELNTTHSEESLETLYGVSFDAPVDAIDYTLENQAVATPYDSMVNFMSDVKDGRKPTDSKLKEAFEVSTNTMVDSWGVKQDNLVNDKGLFRDFMAQTIVMTSVESTKDNPLADRLSATDSQTVLNKTFGPDITPTAIESFTDGYKEVYDVPVDAYNLTMGEVASVMNRPEPEPIKSVLRYKDVFEADSIEALNALEDAVMAEVNREMDAEAKMYDAAAIDPEIEDDDDLEF